MDYTTILISFFGGLGLFVYGMHIMACGLQKSAGNKMQKILEILTKNKFLGILLGALVTAIIQSSSATTVMIVGFVNAGIMNLSQTIGIIMGANIGTTITGWLVSSVEWASFLKPTTIAPIAVAIGSSMILFTKKNSIKQIGEILVGFGILFIGIDTMSGAVSPLKNSQSFRDMFVTFGENPILGVLVGALVTALVQSSSASVGILQSLAISGLVSWNSAVYIIMGQNIGTCITALMSSIGASKNAKGAAYIHLLFNVVGSVIFSILAYLFFMFVYPTFGKVEISITEISIVHTVFNIANTLLMYPFSNLILKVTQKLIDMFGKDDGDEGEDSVHLDDRILETPVFAIQSCIEEVIHLGKMAYKNLNLSHETILKTDFSKIQKIIKREGKIDKLQQYITQYMIKICSMNLNDDENRTVTSLFHTVNDIERIGDHCENLAELSQYMGDNKIKFSEKASKEIDGIIGLTKECVQNSIDALNEKDREKALKTLKIENKIDELEKNLRRKHIERLSNNECDFKISVVFLDCLGNLERISNHASNIAEFAISEIENKDLALVKQELSKGI